MLYSKLVLGINELINLLIKLHFISNRDIWYTVENKLDCTKSYRSNTKIINLSRVVRHLHVGVKI